MIILMIWIVLSVIVGTIGADRKIGFWGGFFLSILLSPLIGFIITILSKSLDKEKLEQEMLENQKEQTRLLTEKSENNTISIADEIEKLSNLKDNGLLTDNEFQQAKQRLIKGE